MVKYLVTVIFVSMGFLSGGCQKTSPSSPDAQVSSSIYVTPPPAGKLPWPQHNPKFTKAEYDAMMDSLFIINNFGQYQGDSSRNFVYFHDGLDVVLPNGTKIYAVDSGYVKTIFYGGEYYQMIVIGNTPGSEPGSGWAYAHTNNFQVKVGDKVSQGQYIADIHFMGVPHVHLNRTFLASGSWDNISNLRTVQSDSYFAYKDTDPPVIESGFRYYRNNSDSLLGVGSSAVVSGAVDIVVGMRERGYYAHSKGGVVYAGFGDRLCVSRIEYYIEGEGGHLFHYNSFNFSTMILGQFADALDRFYTVYKHYYLVHPGGPTVWDKIFSYYIITNTSGAKEAGEINPSDRNFSWNTASTDTDGTPVFPDGKYTVTVKAYDAAGNAASASEWVWVDNHSNSTFRSPVLAHAGSTVHAGGKHVGGIDPGK